MAIYEVHWSGLDNGGEGKWEPLTWLRTLEIMSRHQGEQVYNINAPIYDELERELPDLRWRSEDNGRFRPLFRDYGEPWKETGLLVTENGQLDTFKLTPLAEKLVSGDISPPDVLIFAMSQHIENEEYPYRILASAFLNSRYVLSQELSFDDVYFGVMLNYRPNRDLLAEALLRGRDEVTDISATRKRRLSHMLTLLERVNAIHKTKGDKWIAWDYNELRRIVENHTLSEEYRLLAYQNLDDEDIIFQNVKSLIANGKRNFLFVGPPGTSKTWYALHIGSKLVDHERNRFQNIQFHQSFGYEDFMEGYVPSTSGNANFILKSKVFLEICSKANRNKEQLHVLVIDELNRGDPSRIFGEALTYIERRNEAFTLSSGTKMIVPHNLIILSTINPLDKSIADLDMALERRFVKVDMPPNPDLLRNILLKNQLPNQISGRIIEFFNQLNNVFEDRIGHAYFDNVRDITTLQQLWDFEILPILKKEFKYRIDDIEQIGTRFSTLINEIEAL